MRKGKMLKNIIIAEKSVINLRDSAGILCEKFYDISVSYMDGRLTKQEALDALDNWYRGLNATINNYNYEFNNYLFPYGLNTNLEIENTLNNYIMSIENYVSLVDNVYFAANGYIEGNYTYTYLSQQYLTALVYDVPYEYEQSDKLLKLINSKGY